MKPDTTPVLFVVEETKISSLPVVIESIRRHTDFSTFYVVCPPRTVSRAEVLSSGSSTIHVVDEQSVIPGLDSTVVSNNIPPRIPGWPSPNLACWYYQQFLKMEFARFVPGAEYYLIWDADTVLTRRISFYEQDKVLLTAANEYHSDYFRTIKRILPRTLIPNRSHISQHVLVRTADMRTLLDELSAHGMQWWKYVLSTMTGKSPQQFSEYETYAAYCLSRWPDRYQSIWRRWFRSGSPYFRTELHAADVSILADLYDFVAFEGWDDTPRRRIRSRVRVAKDRVAAWSGRTFGWTWYPK
jgi:hypothetical protein